jgi:hypothetical protein
MMHRDWLKPAEMAELLGFSKPTLIRRSKEWREGKEWRWTVTGSRRERQFHREKVIARINR